MKGCEIVIHTASPFVVTNYKDAVKDIIEPAVIGTENVLNSVNRTESVKRVVLTSSIASTYGDAIEILDTKNNKFDESHWNNTSSETHQPYPFSKVAAERKAWEMAEQQNRWDLVCINPALVMGPSLTANTQSGSVEVLQQFANGMTLLGVPPMWNGIVDVRDVADAHIQAASNTNAKGRYIISGGTLSLLEMGKSYVRILAIVFLFLVINYQNQHLNYLDHSLDFRDHSLNSIWVIQFILMRKRVNKS